MVERSKGRIKKGRTFIKVDFFYFWERKIPFSSLRCGTRGWRLGRIFLQPTTQTRPTTTSGISQLSRMPVALDYYHQLHTWRVPVEENSSWFSQWCKQYCKNARKQKQRDKRTRIKNMTEMCNNIPAPDYETACQNY